MDIRNKVCGTCRDLKPVSQFYKNRHSKDGYLNRCKKCHTKVVSDLRSSRIEAYTPPMEGFEKPCQRCGDTKPAVSFSKDRSKTDGLSAWCKECVADYKSGHYIGTKEYQNKKSKEWYEANSDLVKSRASTRHRTLRRLALEAYSDGDPKCACCGECLIEFLGIDHINGGGKQHLKEIRATNVYYWAKVNKYPAGFQVLCHNCNLAKGFYGECPHVRNRLNAPPLPLADSP